MKGNLQAALAILAFAALSGTVRAVDLEAESARLEADLERTFLDERGVLRCSTGASDVTIWESKGPYENAGIVNGTYLQAMCAKYAVTRDPRDIARAQRAYRAIAQIYELSQKLGEGYFCKPWGWQCQDETSSDQFVYAMLGMDAYYPIASEREQREIADRIPKMARWWIRRNYRYQYLGRPLNWQRCRFPTFAALAEKYAKNGEFAAELKRLLADPAVTNDLPYRCSIERGAFPAPGGRKFYAVSPGTAEIGFNAVSAVLATDPQNAYVQRVMDSCCDLAKNCIAPDGTAYLCLDRRADGSWREMPPSAAFMDPPSGEDDRYNSPLLRFHGPVRGTPAGAVLGMVLMSPHHPPAAAWVKANAERLFAQMAANGFEGGDPFKVRPPEVQAMLQRYPRHCESIVAWLQGYWTWRLLTVGNLARDNDFRTDNLGGVVNWVCIRPQSDRFEILDELGPNGGHAIRLKLSAKGGFHQAEFKYVDNEPYRMSAWVRTQNLQSGNVSLIAYDDWLHINVKSRPFPSDTRGQWVRVEWRGKMFVNIKNASCYFGVLAQKAMGPSEVLDVAGLEIEPLSAQGAMRTVAPQAGKAFKPRIVPIWPKLSEVDLDRPEMTFYYPGDLKGRGSVVVLVDGNRVAKGDLGADRRVTLKLSGIGEGRHRLTAVAGDNAKAVARNDYTITVRRHLSGSAAGTRLNNLVTELPVERTAYGVYFTAPAKGWYFMSADKPAAERMQYLDAGRHPVPFPTLYGAKVVVRKIRQVEIGGESDIMRPTDFSRYFYGIDFFDRFVRPNMNTMAMWEWERKKHARAMSLFEERGVAQTYSISMNCGKSIWSDPVALAAAITNCNGYLEKMLLSLDETAIQRPRKIQYAIAEALWSLAEVEDLRLGVFYNDTMRRVFTDRMIAPSVLAAIANCGNGTGMVRVEAYSAALPTVAATRAQGVDFYPKLQKSVEDMASVASGSVLYHASGYISPYLWCDYPAATADYKVFFSDLIRSYATNPVYRDIAGISFDAISRMDEELLRWMAKVFRYYGIEGHTDDLAAKYGFKYFPGHLVNNDFDRGLEGWTAQPAADGGIRAETIRNFGVDVLCFRECESTPHGDTFAVMKRGAKEPNVLKQVAKGLKPGQRYLFSVVTMDLADVKTPGSIVGPTHFRVDIEGATVIPETRFRQEFATGQSRRSYRGKPCVGRVTDRCVFRAEGETATISLSDWDDARTPGGKIGGETVVTYAICRPYYVESDAEFREIISRWPTTAAKAQ